MEGIVDGSRRGTRRGMVDRCNQKVLNTFVILLRDMFKKKMKGFS